MFARSQTLTGHFFIKPISVQKSWQESKKSSKHNGAFEKWDSDKMVDVQEILTDPNQITLAQKEMHLIRTKIRSWINDDGVSTSSNSIKTPKKPFPTAEK